jgi:hypothetical protein
VRLPEVVLKDAATYIEENGYWNGSDSEIARRLIGKDPVCIVLALGRVTRDGPELEPAIALVENRLGVGSVQGIYAWNDTHTKAEVLALLRGES